MTRKRKKSDLPDNPGRVIVRRLSGLLPYLLMAGFAFNLWFIFYYVRAQKASLDGIRETALGQVSNVYSFVQMSLSNEVQRVRHQVTVLSRPVLSSPQSSTNSPVASFPSSVTNLPPVDVGTVEGIFYRVGGEPFISVEGWHYGIGEDFGLGEITSIRPLAVVCSGCRYRIRAPLSPVAPSLASADIPSKKKEILNE